MKAGSWLNFLHIIRQLIPHDANILEEAIMILWSLWNARNAWIFHGKNTLPKDIVESGAGFLQTYWAHTSVTHSMPNPYSVLNHKWEPPPPGSLMMNTDASYAELGAGYGFVIRDRLGNHVISGAGPLLNVCSAEHAELLGIWRSFLSARQHGFWLSCIETDCELQVRGMQHQESNLLANGAVMDMIYQTCTMQNHIPIQFRHRQTNRVAHKLSKLGSTFSQDMLRTLYPHISVLDNLQSDWSYLN